MLTRSEVLEHASRKSCWVIIKNTVYDLTTFINEHPGGSKVILKYAGKDATEAFEPIHPSDTLDKYIKPEQNLGPVFGPTPPPPAKEAAMVPVVPQKRRIKLSSVVSISDFESAAFQLLPARSFAFLKAGADDEYTARRNQTDWQRLRFRPRVLRPVEHIDLSTTFLGTRYSAPFFICPAGGGKLAHPKGEVLMTKAAAEHGILHWVCNMAGCTQQEMADARGANQTLYWQIYAMTDLGITEKEIKQAVKLGYKGFALTVDAIRPGKRERDIRANIEEEEPAASIEDEDEKPKSRISTLRPPVHATFDWLSSVRWLRSMTTLPIAIKGIQTWEDALLCMQHGVHPWLSNHGGRQLEGAPTAFETLIEIREHCPEVFERCEVIVDGGIRRGTDVIKALALGAKAVGLGRPFLYSLVFGEAGVAKAIRILLQEMETAMALLGVTRVEQLSPDYLKLLDGGDQRVIRNNDSPQAGVSGFVAARARL